MVSLKSLSLFLALCLILSSCLEIRKHFQQKHQQDLSEPKAPKNPKVKQTQAFGGGSGIQFDEWEQSLSQVKRITINSGSRIDAIQFEYENGMRSRQHGGIGGDSVQWTVPYREHIAKVNLRAGDIVESIMFITDQGTESPVWGQNGGGQDSQIVIPEGYKVVGFFGGEGEFLDRIGFNIAPLKETGTRKRI